jgi:hypothetical protein
LPLFVRVINEAPIPANRNCEALAVVQVSPGCRKVEVGELSHPAVNHELVCAGVQVEEQSLSALVELNSYDFIFEELGIVVIF